MFGHIPDIYATKGKEKLIREIETSRTMTADKAQHEAFRRAAKKLKARFRVLKAKMRKK